ncbi:hypothetical protein AB0F65_16835 [Nocardia rhamnosiphila]|uniref:hypothetical protein n=1 Tax=Nocardia rhamnosiphila TaxID=426716 RepID=UPI0033C5AAB0
MGVQVINWQTYYDAAKKCHDLAGELRAADKPVHDTLKAKCGAMAGDGICEPWATTYDRVAQETLQTCTNLADALTNLGYMLSAAGYNLAQSDNANPMPERPSIHQMSVYKVTLPTSKGANGEGIERDGGIAEFYDKLIDEIRKEFGNLPNGNVEKLEAAADTWKTLAEHETITNAPARIAAISDLFVDIEDKRGGLQEMLDHLVTMKSGSELLASASLNLAAPVGTYHAATRDSRTGIENAITNGLWAAGAIAVTGVALTFFTAALSDVAAAGGIVAVVGNTIRVIKSVYDANRILLILGAATAAAGATALTEFDKIPGLTDISTKLAAIIAMKTLINGDGSSAGPANNSNTPGTPEYTKRVEELAQDPAKNGKVSPQSRREAEVGLYNENAGRVGPLERAQPGPNGEDTGEFVDTESGVHWDVKSSPDVIPDYRPADVAGKPIPNIQTDEEFVEMVEDSLADGEGVMIDQSGMTEARKAHLRQIVESHPGWQGKVLW